MPARCVPPALTAGGTCHIRVVKEHPAYPVAVPGQSRSPLVHWRSREIWCPTRDSNPDLRVSETRAYTVSASGAWRIQNTNKKARRPCGASGLSPEDVARATSSASSGTPHGTYRLQVGTPAPRRRERTRAHRSDRRATTAALAQARLARDTHAAVPVCAASFASSSFRCLPNQ